MEDMILPNSYETILDKIKQDWFTAGWEACKDEATNLRHMGLWFEEHQTRTYNHYEDYGDY